MDDLFYIRAVQEEDLSSLYSLIKTIKDGIASLPCDKKLLKERITLSVNSFKKDPLKVTGKEYYMFVLVDVANNSIAGVCAIYGKSGGQSHFNAYKIKHERFSHAPLGVEKAVDALHFSRIPGISELCSLYLNADYRKQGLAPLLTFSRYMFIHRNRKRFSSALIANLRGTRNAEGKSPFWNAIGKHFFGGKLATIDTMKSLGKKQIIRDLMPRHPIYIPLLPEDAQKSIGKTHKNTLAAQKLLEKQGFRFHEWVDILDAGPFFYAKIKDLKLIKYIQSGKISAAIDHKPNKGKLYLLANRKPNFRCCIAHIKKDSKSHISLEAKNLDLLDAEVGDNIDFVEI